MKQLIVWMGMAGVLFAGHVIGLRKTAEPRVNRTIIPVEIDVLTATIRIVAYPRDKANVLQLQEVLDAAEQDWLQDHPYLRVCKRVTVIQPGSLERCIWVRQRTQEKPETKEVKRHDTSA